VKHRGGFVGLWAAAGLVCLAAACGRVPDHSTLEPSSPLGRDASPLPSMPASNASQAVATPPSVPETGESLTIRGWFTIVWNDQAHTFLTDDAGDTHELLLDESLTSPLGGQLALDRKRVVITAVAVAGRPDVLRVTSIMVEAEE